MAIGYEKSEYEIPQSRGMPPVVVYLFGICLVLIFVMGAISIYYAGEFHVWPATDTVKALVSGSF